MKYTITRDINAPIAQVSEIFLNPSAMKKWQPDLTEIERLPGPSNREPGAKMRQLHRMGKRSLWIEETVTRNDPPQHFCATYEAGKVWNLIESQFDAVGETQTRWTLTTTFKARGFMALMMRLSPGMFKKQTAAFMDRFVAYAEAQARATRL
jgi:uncharacterized protein YndB with AHSA1/START domain